MRSAASEGGVIPRSEPIRGGAVWYGRLYTKDMQDSTLSLRTQRAACEKKARSLGLRIVADFIDHESGRPDDREGWRDLIAEGRDRKTRRFDTVIMYTTSRPSRVLLTTVAAERELDRLGIQVHYSFDEGDRMTPEGLLARQILQALQDMERSARAASTRRGRMRADAKKGATRAD